MSILMGLLWSRAGRVVLAALGGVLLAAPAVAQQSDAERYIADARRVLDYYLADNTADLQFRFALESDKAEAAAALLSKALALEPDNASARGWLALAYQCLQRPDEASEHMRRALRDGLAGAPWVNLAGDIEDSRGDLSAALDYYTRASTQRSNMWHQWDLARTLAAIGDPAADAAWDQLVQQYGTNADAWLERGWYAYELGDTAQARIDYEKALELAGRQQLPADSGAASGTAEVGKRVSAEAHNRLGILLAAEGNRAGAEKHYRDALSLAPTPAFHANLIAVLAADPARSSDLDKAWRDLLAQFPDDPIGLRGHADRLYATGSHQAALESYQRALAASGPDAALLNSIGNTLFGLERFTEAAQQYDASLKLAYDPIVASNLAGAQHSAGQNDAARLTWQKHVALHGDDPMLRLGYANALFENDQYAEALEQYERAAGLGADDPELFNQWGLALLKLTRPADAAEQFARAVELRPDAVYFGNAGYAYGLAGEWRRAETLYRAGLAQHPADADLVEGLGEALTAQGRSGEAADELLRAAQAEPVSVEVAAAPVVTSAEPPTPAVTHVATPSSAEPEARELSDELPAEEPTEGVQAGPASGEENLAVTDVAGDPDEPLDSPSDPQLESADKPETVTTHPPAANQSTAAVTTSAGHAEMPAGENAAQARLYAQAARAAEDSGNLEQALQSYQRSFETQPELNATTDYALLLAEMARTTQLTELLTAARTRLGSEPAAQILDRLTRHWLERKEYAVGAAFMERMIAADPRVPAPYNQLALIRAAQQDFSGALSVVKRGLNDAEPTYLGRYLEAYLTLAVSGPQAALPLARAVANDPKAERNAFVLYMRMLEQNGSYGESAEIGDIALTRYPDHPALLGFYARALYFNGDAARAVELLEDPRYSGVPYRERDEALGLSYLDLGNYVRAAGYLTSASRAKPENSELLAALGQAQFFMGEREAARSTLTQALQLDPILPAAHLWHGWVLTEAGDAEGAQAAFARVEKSPLAQKEDHAWLALGRAQLALARGDRAAASALLNQAEAFGLYSDGFYDKLDELRAR